jgi:hypothetical protein
MDLVCSVACVFCWSKIRGREKLAMLPSFEKVHLLKRLLTSLEVSSPFRK